MVWDGVAILLHSHVALSKSNDQTFLWFLWYRYQSIKNCLNPSHMFSESPYVRRMFSHILMYHTLRHKMKIWKENFISNTKQSDLIFTRASLSCSSPKGQHECSRDSVYPWSVPLPVFISSVQEFSLWP